MTTATTVTLDRELVENFIVEVDALATFDTIRNGGQQTRYAEIVYGILEPFERAALGPKSDEEAIAFHERGNERGRELAREFLGGWLEREESDDAR